MNPLDAIFGRNPPPAKLKVFAPNGETKECVAYLGIRVHGQYEQLTELFLQHDNGKIEVLNKQVVVLNQETGEVSYNPRTVPKSFGNKSFITGSERFWLEKNPHWPAILELWDNPVENGEAKDGLNP